MPVNRKQLPNGKENVTITCECGKPLVKANEDGMFCEDDCGLEQAREAKAKIMDMMRLFLPIECAFCGREAAVSRKTHAHPTCFSCVPGAGAEAS
jgi:hypothetical protein